MKKLFLAALLMIMPGLMFAQQQMRSTLSTIFPPEIFDEPHEIMVIVFEDGSKITTTLEDEQQVRFPFELIEQLKMKVSQVTHVIHSHPHNLPEFSPDDVQLYKNLLRQGMKGSFLLYHNISGATLRLNLRPAEGLSDRSDLAAKVGRRE